MDELRDDNSLHLFYFKPCSYYHAHNDIKFEEICWQPIYFPARRIGLYPHTIEDIVIIVPSKRTVKSNLLEIICESPILQIWMPFIVACTIIRQFLARRGQTWTTISTTFFDTFSLAIGENAKSGLHLERAEKLVTLFISFFSILSGVLFTGALFQKFTINVVSSNIDTLAELEESGLTLFMCLFDNINVRFEK